MERFELTVVAQGSQSILVAVLVVALICTTIIAIAALITAAKLWRGTPNKPWREQAETPSAYDLGKDLFGEHGSGRKDLSTNRKALFDEVLRAKHHR